MRTQVLFNNVDASQSHSVDVGLTSPLETNAANTQDVRFLIQASKTGTDGNPRLIIEESIDGNIWTALEDTETWNPYTEITDVIGVKDNYFMAKYMRVRLEPNATTTGTVYAIIGYKTKP
jgi:hypothetical protein